MWSSTRIWLQDDQALLSTQGALGQIEARAGLMFGRFELALEVAPELAGALAMGITSRHSTASLSAGWSFVLHERDGFAISLPVRVRAGGFFTSLNGVGGLAGCSAGVALRFGSAVLEARPPAPPRPLGPDSSAQATPPTLRRIRTAPQFGP